MKQNNNDKLRLCLGLMKADTEEEVIQLLTEAGFWDNPDVWRNYGDIENNYSVIGNQQSNPDAALVEKIVNSVDARLMNECLVKKIAPDGEEAPESIREAVAMFFDGVDRDKANIKEGILEWPEYKRTEIAREIAFVATGGKRAPSFTIVDCGEGQTPEQMPNTLLSINKSNKMRIKFVQGRFNMGGTGALPFCGKNRLQFILSRRNPAISDKHVERSPDRDKWGFTIVRRESPQNARSSIYRYLVLPSSREKMGGVLRFRADELPIFPERRKAYAKNAEWGTLIKLYEYSLKGSSHILMKDGLLRRIDMLLPYIALPVRFHECREFKGGEGSFDTTLTGIGVRLADDRGKSLEDGFPTGGLLNVDGEKITVKIYAFRKEGGKIYSETYRQNEGVIFVMNGQTQGHWGEIFFSRKKVGLSYLADSILVIVDCTELNVRARDDLFMNSRDRLRKSEFSTKIENLLEQTLKEHKGLRALKEKRRREQVDSALGDDKPLENILEKICKESPTLSDLFRLGTRVPTPFKTTEVQVTEKFKGKKFPTYFKFKDISGHILHKDCPINRRCRLAFETDVENEYFTRNVEPGKFDLTQVREEGEPEAVEKNYRLNLRNGIATLNLPLPESAAPGKDLHYVAETDDCSRIEPFTNEFFLTIKEAQSDPKRPGGIEMPKITEITKEKWSSVPGDGGPFDKYSAMRIIRAEEDIYDFYVNVNNVYLEAEMKSTKLEPTLVKNQFKLGMVLLGLAMLKQDVEEKRKKGDEKQEEENDGSEPIEIKVEKCCRAFSQFILPIINSLSSEKFVSDVSGEVT